MLERLKQSKCVFLKLACPAFPENALLLPCCFGLAFTVKTNARFSRNFYENGFCQNFQNSCRRRKPLSWTERGQRVTKCQMLKLWIHFQDRKHSVFTFEQQISCSSDWRSPSHSIFFQVTFGDYLPSDISEFVVPHVICVSPGTDLFFLLPREEIAHSARKKLNFIAVKK